MRKAFLFSTLVLLAGGCFDPNAPDDEFQRERQAWEALGIENYQYELGVGCFCGVDQSLRVLVTVENRVVTSKVWADSLTVIPEWWENLYISVDDLFEVIGEALRQKAHELVVTYHAELHYPTSVWIDYQENVADEEIRYEASDLVQWAY